MIQMSFLEEYEHLIIGGLLVISGLVLISIAISSNIIFVMQVLLLLSGAFIVVGLFIICARYSCDCIELNHVIKILAIYFVIAAAILIGVKVLNISIPLIG